MKRFLTTVLAVSLLSGTAVLAQPNNPNRSDQTDNRGDQNSKDQKDQGRGRGAPATPSGQSAPKGAAPNAPASQATRERAAPTAPPSQATRERAAPTAPPSQATRERAAPTPPPSQATRERATPSAPTGQATRERATPSAPTGQATRERVTPSAPIGQVTRERAAPTPPTGQTARERAAPPPQNVQDQNRFQDLRNNPDYRVATPRFSRGDRLPDQYRQNQYYVSDWQQHGLRQPPGGYRWIRDDNNDFFLALISTGIITDIVYRDDRDQVWRQHYARTYTYDDDIYYRDCRNGPDPAGVMIGALIGGLLGNAAGDGRTGTTIAGVIVGGAVGAALTSNLDCEDRSYAYKAYYDGFNSGRPGSRYGWVNPRNDHRGEFLIRTYYNDPYGFRCANFTQTIYIQGRPQEARGVACRQPDGAWAIIS